jgi:hypothetical protein
MTPSRDGLAEHCLQQGLQLLDWGYHGWGHKQQDSSRCSWQPLPHSKVNPDLVGVAVAIMLSCVVNCCEVCRAWLAPEPPPG